MTSETQIEALIDRLAREDTAADTFNEYAYDIANNDIRRQNLRLYFGQISRLMPDTMLVMEAPGYRGCRLTGVPVTSRKVLLEGVPGLDIFGSKAGYRDVDEAGFEDIYGEQTATIVWDALSDLRVLPFIWNTFPFHPCKLGIPRSNRKPRRAETESGAVFLREVMELWRFQRVIAVGNVASETLGKIGINCDKVRHPAQGGKNEFVAGLKSLFRG
ncbi:MAG: uracil-DNA glycosylase [Chloroflexi bacterium]|nr:uracil-DNA glycosylase [Chloroflexota bacterium]